MSDENRPRAGVGVLAHHAIGTLVEMYAEILRAYEQREQVLKMQIVALRSQLELNAKEQSHAVQVGGSETQVPRNGIAGGDR